MKRTHRFRFSFPTAGGLIDVSANSHAEAVQHMKKTGVDFDPDVCEMTEIKPRGGK
jgi:hypothetical protein